MIARHKTAALLLIASLANSCSRQEKSPDFEAKAEWATKAFPSPVITQDALLASEDSILLVDTRTIEEYAVSHLPGAINWSEFRTEPIPESVSHHLAEGGTVVFYCSIGYRSGEAAMRAEELLGRGHSLYNLRGGIFQWANEGRTLEGGDRVHGFDAEWGRLLDPSVRWE